MTHTPKGADQTRAPDRTLLADNRGNCYEMIRFGRVLKTKGEAETERQC